MKKTLIIPGAMAAALLSTAVLADRSDVEVDRATQGASSSPGISADTSEGHPRFDELDRNRDGELSQQELNVWGSTAAGNETDDEARREMMMDYDENNDGSLSPDEYEVYDGPRKDRKDAY